MQRLTEEHPLEACPETRLQIVISPILYIRKIQVWSTLPEKICHTFMMKGFANALLHELIFVVLTPERENETLYSC